MKLFDTQEEKQEITDRHDAYTATPHFYRKPDGEVFGAIALTEGTETILPKNPQAGYQVNGKIVSEWKLVLVSISEDAVIGEADYVSALKKAETYALDANEKFILIYCPLLQTTPLFAMPLKAATKPSAL